jgi:L-lactate dehydrogenase
MNGLGAVTGGRVCVVGCGHVGTTSAYALMLGGLAREIVLLDVDARRAEGEAMDLQQSAALTRPVEVRAGDWSDAARARTSQASS